ncbi:MAG TPA: DNA-3-methyladenine glycosylase 2 family protein [Acidimicrobiia bacterium]|nr:DNA-3-methyladenine glycosylase 2 family protein [Acidimicrobiia bacterium]
MTPPPVLSQDDFVVAARQLATTDPSLAAVIAARGLPDFWHRPPGFATMCLFIVEQQVSLASAKAVFDRIVGRLGTLSPTSVLTAGPDVLGQSGVTRQKQRYLLGLAALIESGDLDLDGLEALPDEEVRRILLGITGIGPWTADVYLLSALRRPDSWPVGDRALQVGVRDVLELEAMPTPSELDAIGERWRPWRSVAARLIWHDYLARRGRTETDVAGLVP